MTLATMRHVLLAAALAAAFAVFTAAVGIWRAIAVENEVLGTHSACDCCEEPGR